MKRIFGLLCFLFSAGRPEIGMRRWWGCEEEGRSEVGERGKGMVYGSQDHGRSAELEEAAEGRPQGSE